MSFLKIVMFNVFFFWLALYASSQGRLSMDTSKKPYLLVDTFVTDLNYLVLSPEKIESVSVLKDSSAIALYGDKALHGAIIIKTKSNTKLLQVAEIFDKYKIAEGDRQLRIYINNTPVSHPERLLVDAGEIMGVEITTDKFWVNPEDANSSEKVIHIKTNSKTNK